MCNNNFLCPYIQIFDLIFRVITPFLPITIPIKNRQHPAFFISFSTPLSFLYLQFFTYSIFLISW